MEIVDLLARADYSTKVPCFHIRSYAEDDHVSVICYFAKRPTSLEPFEYGYEIWRIQARKAAGMAYYYSQPTTVAHYIETHITLSLEY